MQKKQRDRPKKRGWGVIKEIALILACILSLSSMNAISKAFKDDSKEKPSNIVNNNTSNNSGSVEEPEEPDGAFVVFELADKVADANYIVDMSHYEESGDYVYFPLVSEPSYYVQCSSAIFFNLGGYFGSDTLFTSVGSTLFVKTRSDVLIETVSESSVMDLSMLEFHELFSVKGSNLALLDMDTTLNFYDSGKELEFESGYYEQFVHLVSSSYKMELYESLHLYVIEFPGNFTDSCGELLFFVTENTYEGLNYGFSVEPFVLYKLSLTESTSSPVVGSFVEISS